MAIPVPSTNRSNGRGTRPLRISEPTTVVNRKTSSTSRKSKSSTRNTTQELSLCAHPSLRGITDKLTAIQIARTESRYSSASAAPTGSNSNTSSSAVQLPKVPKPRPKLSDIPPAHRAVWGKFVKGKVPVPGKVKHDKLCGRCGERSHRNAGGNGPFGEAFRVPDSQGGKDSKAVGKTNQRTVTTTTTKTSGVSGQGKTTTTTSVTTGPPSANPAPLPIQLYAPDCVLFDDPSALDDFRPRYTRPGPPPPPPMMGGRRRPHRHDPTTNYPAPTHPHTHIHCNCAAKRSTDPDLIASIQGYIHSLFTLKYAQHDLPHSFFDKVREAEKGLIPLLLRDGVVDVARRRGDLGEMQGGRRYKAAGRRDIAVAGRSSGGSRTASEGMDPAVGPYASEVPPVKPALSRGNSHDSRVSETLQAREEQTQRRREMAMMTPDLSLNLKLDAFPTPEMVFDMREEMRDVVGEFLSE